MIKDKLQVKGEGNVDRNSRVQGVRSQPCVHCCSTWRQISSWSIHIYLSQGQDLYFTLPLPHKVTQLSRIVDLNYLQVMGSTGSSHFSPHLWVRDFFPFPSYLETVSLHFSHSGLIHHWAFSSSSSPSPLPQSPCLHRKTSPVHTPTILSDLNLC